MRKKIGLVCLALVLALGTLGVGYALWWDVLSVSGNVHTGDLEARWSVESTGDSEAANKDFSSVSAKVTDSGKTLQVTIKNAYPCIDYWVNFDIRNTGTMALHLCPPVQATTGLSPGQATFSWLKKVGGNPINWSNVQIHPGKENAFLGYLVIHLSNCVDEGWDYTFNFDLMYYNYNETVTCPSTYPITMPPCP